MGRASSRTPRTGRRRRWSGCTWSRRGRRSPEAFPSTIQVRALRTVSRWGPSARCVCPALRKHRSVTPVMEASDSISASPPHVPHRVIELLGPFHCPLPSASWWALEPFEPGRRRARPPGCPGLFQNLGTHLGSPLSKGLRRGERGNARSGQRRGSEELAGSRPGVEDGRAACLGHGWERTRSGGKVRRRTGCRREATSVDAVGEPAAGSRVAAGQGREGLVEWRCP